MYKGLLTLLHIEVHGQAANETAMVWRDIENYTLLNIIIYILLKIWITVAAIPPPT